jgi:hypothetical protein
METGLLPTILYETAKRQQTLWNTLVEEQDRRYQAWKASHESEAITVTIESSGTSFKKYPKPHKEYWNSFDQWALQAVKDSDLNWETGPDVFERYKAVYRRVKSGGGFPTLKKGLRNFSIAHRYTAGGMPLEKLGGRLQTRFRIALPSEKLYENNTRENRRSRLTSAWFGIEKEQISLKVVVHRRIPTDAVVKRIALTGMKQSPAMRWKFALVFTVEEPMRERHAPWKECIGIDIGWRKMDESLRVCVAYDGSNHLPITEGGKLSPHGAGLFLPLSWSSKDLGEVSLERKRSIQSYRDQLLEQCKESLRQQLPHLPAAFAQMRNGGLVRLLRVLEENGSNSCSVDMIRKWKRNNDQLTRKMLLLDNRMRSRREWVYRNFASRIASEYKKIRVENIELHEMAAKNSVKESPALQAAAHYRNYAACGELLAALKHAAGERVEMINARLTTRLCAKCGAVFESESELVGHCSNLQCSSSNGYDQDWNAAENIYANRPPDWAEMAFAANS